MHFKASWLSGAACPDAVDLAHKAACALDAPKLGLAIRPDVLRRDVDRFDRATQMPRVWHACTGREVNEQDSRPHAADRPQHILAILDRSSRKVKDAALARAHAAVDAVPDVPDPDLSRKWKDAQQLYADDALAVVDLEAIATSVRAAIEAYGRAGPRFGPDSPRKPVLLLSPSKKRKRDEVDELEAPRVTVETLALDFAAGATDRSSFQSSCVHLAQLVLTSQHLQAHGDQRARPAPRQCALQPQRPSPPSLRPRVRLAGPAQEPERPRGPSSRSRRHLRGPRAGRAFLSDLGTRHSA